MRVIFALLFSTALLGGKAQNVETDSLGFQRFSYQEGDTTFHMKQYFLVLLKRGESREQAAGDAAEIQAQHLQHINWMAEQGYLDLAGPMGDDGELRGIFILRVPDKAKALELTQMDPAVKAGRLRMEIHPWWALEGACLK